MVTCLKSERWCFPGTTTKAWVPTPPASDFRSKESVIGRIKQRQEEKSTQEDKRYVHHGFCDSVIRIRFCTIYKSIQFIVWYTYYVYCITVSEYYWWNSSKLLFKRLLRVIAQVQWKILLYGSTAMFIPTNLWVGMKLSVHTKIFFIEQVWHNYYIPRPSLLAHVTWY